MDTEKRKLQYEIERTMREIDMHTAEEYFACGRSSYIIELPPLCANTDGRGGGHLTDTCAIELNSMHVQLENEKRELRGRYDNMSRQETIIICDKINIIDNLFARSGAYKRYLRAIEANEKVSLVAMSGHANEISQLKKELSNKKKLFEEEMSNKNKELEYAYGRKSFLSKWT